MISNRTRVSTALLLATLLLTAARAEIPAEHFARHPEFTDIKISPDGRYFAATVPRNDETVLVIIDRSDMKSGTVLTRGANKHIDWFEWANDNRLMYQFFTQRGGLDFPLWYGEIFASDADGRNHRSIFGYDGYEKSTGTRRRTDSAEHAWGRVIDMLPEDPDSVLILSQPWARGTNVHASVLRLDVNRGITRKIGKVPMRDVWVLAAQQRLRLAAGIVEDYEWKVVHRQNEDSDWTENKLLSDSWFRPIKYSHDGTKVFGLAQDDSTVTSLFSYSANDNSLQPLVAAQPFDATVPLLAPRTGDLLGVYSDADRFSYTFIDQPHPLIGVYRSVLKAFAGQRVFITSATSDYRELILRVSSDKNAADYFLFDVDKMNASFLLSSRPWLDPAQMASVEPINFSARDATSVHGYITYPAGQRENLPLVVYPHGGPHGVRDIWAFNAIAQFLASRGYAVLQPNFRGSGGYGRDFEESGYREWGGKMQDDLTDATLWAIEQGIADPKRICIYGASYGGYAALMGVAREPQLYQCAIGSVGVYDLALMFSKGDITDWIPGQAYLEKIISDDPEFLAERSPITYADKIKVPVFLIHGGRDQRVPLAHAKAMRSALTRAGNKPKWLLFKDEAHGYYKVDNRTELLTEVEAFLAKHIGN